MMVSRIFQKVSLQWLTVDKTLQNGTLKASVPQIVHPNGSDDLVTKSVICSDKSKTQKSTRIKKKPTKQALCCAEW
jgi:hypothetical protein